VTQRSTVTGTNESGSGPDGTWAGQLAHCVGPGFVRLPVCVIVGTGEGAAADPVPATPEPLVAEPVVGEALAEGALPAPLDDAATAPHPAASAATASVAMAFAIAGIASRARGCDIMMSLDRFCGRTINDASGPEG